MIEEKLLVSKKIKDGVDLESFMEDLLSAAPCENFIILTDHSTARSINSISDAVCLRSEKSESAGLLREDMPLPTAYYKGIPVYAEARWGEDPRVDLIKL